MGPASCTAIESIDGSCTKQRQMDGRDKVPVYDADFKYSVAVPRTRITHLPSTSRRTKRQLVFCNDYNEGKCNSPTCPFVHADVEGLERHTIHVNYSWQSESSVAYARLPAGETLHVLAPNNRPPMDTIPSERVLFTNGSQEALLRPDQPLEQCAHYYFNHVCNRGESCSFIHAIHIDSTATPYQRAPVQVVKRCPPANDSNTLRSISSDSPSAASSLSQNQVERLTLHLRGQPADLSALPSRSATPDCNNKEAIAVAPTATKENSSIRSPVQFYLNSPTMMNDGLKTFIVNSEGRTIAYRNHPYGPRAAASTFPTRKTDVAISAEQVSQN